VVIEACWNWQRIYELLEEIKEVEEIVVSNPWKTRVLRIALRQRKRDFGQPLFAGKFLKNGPLQRVLCGLRKVAADQVVPRAHKRLRAARVALACAATEKLTVPRPDS
jgi:hypothetical protein